MYYLTTQQLNELQNYLDSIQSIINNAKQHNTGCSVPTKRISRAMSKAELAATIGVAPRTLYKWMLPLRAELRSMGVKDTAKVIPLQAVNLICERLVVD